ncbi:MAG TPA: hypothetical protein VF774_29790 [Pseudoduganella sp.]|jgi:hypothetical protein
MKGHMFPKPPRPEPPRRAIATQVAQQRATQRAPDVLIVERPARTPEAQPVPPRAPLAAPVVAAEPGAAAVPPADGQPF